jgi:nitrogen fixation protein FixH
LAVVSIAPTGSTTSASTSRDCNRCAAARRGQRYVHAGQIGLARTLETIAVDVLEDVAGDGALELETDVGGGAGAANRHGDGLWIVGGGQCTACGIGYIDVDVAGRDAARIVAVGVGRDRNRCAAAGWRQDDIDTRQVRLAGALDTVTIHIIKNVAGDRTLELEPNVRRRARAADRYRDSLWIVARRQRTACGIGYIDIDIAGRDTARVVAVGVGCHRDRRAATGRCQDNVNTRQVGLARALGTVTIHIVEYVTGDRALELEPDVRRSARATYWYRDGLWIVGRRERTACGIGDIDIDVAGRYAARVVAVGVGRHCDRRAAAGRGQRNINTRQVRLARTLCTVTVDVLKDVAGDRATELEPDIAGRAGATDRYRNGLRIAVRRSSSCRSHPS